MGSAQATTQRVVTLVLAAALFLFGARTTLSAVHLAPSRASGAVLSPAASGPSVRAVRIAAEGAAIVITIEADGALPSPNVGVLSDPPRIYLDLPGVGAATRGMNAGEHSLVRRVRVAVNRLEPLVTRIVIDLLEPVPHSIDAGLRGQGRISIVISNPTAQIAAAPVPAAPGQTPLAPVPPNAGSAAAPQAPPPKDAPVGAVPPPVPAVTAAPAAPPVTVPVMPSPGAAPPSPAPRPEDTASRAHAFAEFALGARAAATPAPEKDVRRYLRAASPLLQRLEKVRPVLVSLDALDVVPEKRLKDAAQEFEAIDRGLTVIDVPGTLKNAHEELRRVCALGAVAARARVDGTAPDDVTRAWNAAAAAAGAMMLLERARAEMGISRTPTAEAPRLP